MLLCDGFFDCASVLTKSLMKMTLSFANILNIAFVALYHIIEIGRRAGHVRSYTLRLMYFEQHGGGGLTRQLLLEFQLTPTGQHRMWHDIVNRVTFRARLDQQ